MKLLADVLIGLDPSKIGTVPRKRGRSRWKPPRTKGQIKSKGKTRIQLMGEDAILRAAN